MKTFSKQTFFGSFSTVAPTRSTSVDPELIVTSTPGGFRMTPQVSSALGMANGDYAMLLNNFDSLRQMVIARNEEVINYANSICPEGANIDSYINTPEFMNNLISKYGTWLIAKGIKEYNSLGQPEKRSERITISQKIEYIQTDFDKFLEEALQSGEEELIQALTVEGITQEDQVKILAGLINGKEIDRFRGAKCADNSGLTGTGRPLTFSDSTAWNLIKSDIATEEERISINRTFEVLTDQAFTVTMNDGFKDVEVLCLPLGEYKDAAPIARKKSTTVETTSNTETAEVNEAENHNENYEDTETYETDEVNEIDE